ncbi:hypothetical protein [Neomoorella humiferrea]|uniref:hypothetical protein n=1 Tax=Neomoorella humiferrea TaxID=676965 RepID=UPI0030CC8032
MPENLTTFIYAKIVFSFGYIIKKPFLVYDSNALDRLVHLYGITGGLPRLVNNLVTTCLICACGKKQRLIDEEIVYQAQRELEI